jgi:plasmid stabilization system protein ParE
MPVIFHRLALTEYRRAIAAYRRQDVDVARRFVSVVEDAADRIDQNPPIGSPCFGPYRWVRVRRFPYLLYYRELTPTLTLTYAVAHARRRPGYWLRRTRRP